MSNYQISFETKNLTVLLTKSKERIICLQKYIFMTAFYFQTIHHKIVKSGSPESGILSIPLSDTLQAFGFL